MSSSEQLRDVVAAYLADQCTVIIDAEPSLRRREGVIHSTRVAVRRLRSTLRTFDDLVDVARAGALEDELVWYAGLLGAVRDLDILIARLEGQLAELPPELVVGPVARKITEELDVRRAAGWAAVLEALDGERYRALIAELRRWRADPPFTAEADRPAKKIKKYLQKADRRLRHRLRDAVAAALAGAPEADELMHRARKAGKRHRYAVELAQPVWGAKADQIIADRKELQDVLGEHQDSHVAAAFLREEGVRLGARAGTNGFTYGLLYARELDRQARIGDRLAPFLD